MNFDFIHWRSLKTRITFATLSLFVLGTCLIWFYTLRKIHIEMEKSLSEQQLSFITVVASEISNDMNLRLKSLEKVAFEIDSKLMTNPRELQRELENRKILPELFNAGFYVADTNGNAIASLPTSIKRIGVNFMERDHVATALKEGRTAISEPTIGKVLLSPVVGVATPLRNNEQKVVGVLVGVIDLNQPNFLDDIVNNKFGHSGGYILVDRRTRRIITASDRGRIMERLPPVGSSPTIDQFINGKEGSEIFVNPKDVEVLASVKMVPNTTWYAISIIPTKEAFLPVHNMERRSFFGTIFLTSLIGCFCWWMLQSQLSPLLLTINLLTKMSQKNQLLHPLPVNGDNEISDLLKSFNRLLVVLADRETALKESEVALRESQSIANLGSYVFDIVQGHWSSSDICDKVFGIEKNYRRDYPGWLAILHPDEVKRMGEYFVTEVVGKGLLFDEKYRIIRPSDKAIRWVHGLGKLEFDEKGHPVRMYGTIQDITERMEIERSLRDAKDKAEESDRLKSAFLSNMSHEIRTPMNGILGFSELLLTPQLPEGERVSYAQMVNQSSRRLLTTISDILDLSRLDAGQAKINNGEFKISKTLEDLYQIHQRHFLKHNVAFKISIDSKYKLLVIDNDEEKIFKILNNLLVNASRFTSTGEVEFGFSIVDQMLHFFVKDTGIGIATDKLPKIFTRFFQEDLSLNRGHEGAGLGLAISKGLVTLLGGKIWVESEKGVGSIFKFVIPSTVHFGSSTIPIIEMTSKEVSTNYDWSHKTALIVEDDLTNFKLVESILGSCSKLKIIHAENGSVALDIFKSNQNIDIILMDLKMPVMDGFVAMKMIREMNKVVPIVAVSAYDLKEDRLKAIEAGCNKFISKPYESKSLLKLIDEFI